MSIASTVGALAMSPRAAACATIASANPCHDVCPDAARCQVPLRSGAASAAAVASAIHAAGVGEPVWSATTRSTSRSPARRSIVSRKLRPRGP